MGSALPRRVSHSSSPTTRAPSATHRPTSRSTTPSSSTLSPAPSPSTSSSRLATCAWSLAVVTLVALASSNPAIATLVPLTLSTSRMRPAPPSPPVCPTFSSLAVASGRWSPCPAKRASASPLRRSVRSVSLLDKHCHLLTLYFEYKRQL